MNKVISKERQDLDERCKDLEKQLKDIELHLNNERSKHEHEIIRRVDAENKLLTLKEEADFNIQVHQKVSFSYFFVLQVDD